MTAGRTIFVDLDGTLVRTDLFLESIFAFLKADLLNVFRLMAWLMRGIPYAKAQVADHVRLDPARLPLEHDLLAYLATQKAAGRGLILATAAHRRQAHAVAAHLGIFDDVLATEDHHNLKGRNKLAAIRELMGTRGFCYAGDSAADRPIWRAAASNILVNAPAGCVSAAHASGKAEKVIQSRPPQWRAFLKAMRPHQYAKNALIFVPLLAAHQYLDPQPVVASLLAFVCFSLCASGVYFLNDLLDIASDRQHPTKRRRPLASGDLSLRLGAIGAVALPTAAFALAAALLPTAFFLALTVYYLLTNAYSFLLKRISTADVMTLAVLYTLRVVAGAAAAGIALSSWLLAFSVFVFVSLGYLKRYIEVAAIADGADKAPGRGYSGFDRETMFTLGVANITASVVILALYISSAEVVHHYGTPDVLWLMCLLLLYWGNRVWIGARRGKIQDDPVVFALRDNVSRAVIVALGAVVISAKYLQL